VAWLTSAAMAGLAAQWLIGHVVAPAPIDAAMPLYAAGITLLAFLVRTHPAYPFVQVAAVVLLLVEIAVPDEPMRLLLIGVTLAAAASVAIAAALEEGGGALPMRQAQALAAVLLVWMRCVPWPGTRGIIEAIVLAGIVLLLHAVSRQRRVSLLAFAVVLAIGIVTPAVPGKASLYPLVLAGLVRFFDRRSIVVGAITLLLSIAAGRIFALAAAVALAAAMLEAWRSRRAGVQLVTGPAARTTGRASGWAGAIRVAWSSSPSAVNVESTRFAAIVTTAALVLIAVFGRASTAPLAALAASILMIDRRPGSRFVTASACTFAFLLIGFAAWSGLVARTFPLPLQPTALAVLALVPAAGQLSSIAGGAAAFAMLANPAHFTPPVPPRSQTLSTSVPPGTSAAFDVPPNLRRISVILSAANAADLSPGTTAGIIEIRDRDGHIVRRTITFADLGDWGFLRREHYYYSRNVLPADSAGRRIGYGKDAWINGSGRVTLALPHDIVVLRVTAAATLPKSAVLQVDAIEMPQ
jgi:hypothetical protein